MRAQESQFAVPVLGLPALSVPTGLAGALPMGVQLIGPRFREDLLFDAAEVIEARCPPHDADRSALNAGRHAAALPAYGTVSLLLY